MSVLSTWARQRLLGPLALGLPASPSISLAAAGLGVLLHCWHHATRPGCHDGLTLLCEGSMRANGRLVRRVSTGAPPPDCSAAKSAPPLFASSSTHTIKQGACKHGVSSTCHASSSLSSCAACGRTCSRTLHTTRRKVGGLKRRGIEHSPSAAVISHQQCPAWHDRPRPLPPPRQHPGARARHAFRP